MKTRAAVAVAAEKPLEITEVDLDGPKDGEVLVEIKATGIYHTDAFTFSGARMAKAACEAVSVACYEGTQITGFRYTHLLSPVI